MDFGLSGGDILSAGASLIGGIQANKANKKIAREQMAFQERMSNTAMQRRVEDLKAAGLNPMLAYNDGSSSPSGASAHMDNVGESAARGFSSGASAKAAIAQVDNIKSQTDLNKDLMLKAKADTLSSAATADFTRANTQAVQAGLPQKELIGSLWDSLGSYTKPLANSANSGGDDWLTRLTSGNSASSASKSLKAKEILPHYTGKYNKVK